jgi:hypothetical protein
VIEQEQGKGVPSRAQNCFANQGIGEPKPQGAGIHHQGAIGDHDVDPRNFAQKDLRSDAELIAVIATAQIESQAGRFQEEDKQEPDEDGCTDGDLD